MLVFHCFSDPIDKWRSDLKWRSAEPLGWVPGFPVLGSRVPGYWFRDEFGGFWVPGLPGSQSISSAKTIH
eukprot:3274596-Pyramimonas_sp.AAC.1